MVFRRHCRIKILSEAGYKWGSLSIQYYAPKSSQRVSDIEGQTLLLAADGSVRREKLDKKSIFDEDVDGEWRRIRFTLPALREEPYMTTPDDYAARVRFQLARFVWPGTLPVEFMTTWEKLAEELMDEGRFGGQIERHDVLRRQAETLVADRIVAAHAEQVVLKRVTTSATVKQE